MRGIYQFLTHLIYVSTLILWYWLHLHEISNVKSLLMPHSVIWCRCIPVKLPLCYIYSKNTICSWRERVPCLMRNTTEKPQLRSGQKMCGNLFWKTKFSKFPFGSLGICWSETFKLLWDSFTLTACCFEASIVFVNAHLQPLSLFLLGRSTSQSSLLSYSPNPYSTLIIETVSKGQKK